jgi:hypothetical protein
MVSGKIQKIKKDHRSWLSLIEEFQNEISQMGDVFRNDNSLKTSKFLNNLLHHERILNKLHTAIDSHRVFIDEIAGDPGITMDLLDIEGHERNHQHLLNFEDSFRKLIHEVHDSASHEGALN